MVFHFKRYNEHISLIVSRVRLRVRLLEGYSQDQGSQCQGCQRQGNGQEAGVSWTGRFIIYLSLIYSLTISYVHTVYLDCFYLSFLPLPTSSLTLAPSCLHYDFFFLLVPPFLLPLHPFLLLFLFSSSSSSSFFSFFITITIITKVTQCFLMEYYSISVRLDLVHINGMALPRVQWSHYIQKTSVFRIISRKQVFDQMYPLMLFLATLLPCSCGYQFWRLFL